MCCNLSIPQTSQSKLGFSLTSATEPKGVTTAMRCFFAACCPRAAIGRRAAEQRDELAPPCMSGKQHIEE
jgi:hypothetical protein